MDKNSACAIKTKKKMAGALKELMNTVPFEKITVSDITEACQVHRQTFYYHFQDRYQLLDWLVYNELIEPFITDFTFDNMYERFLKLFTTMYQNKKFYQSAIKINMADLHNYISRVAQNQFTDVIKILGRESMIEPQSEDEDIMYAEFFGYGLSGIVLSWANRGMKETPEQMTQRVEHLAEICKEIGAQRAK